MGDAADHRAAAREGTVIGRDGVRYHRDDVPDELVNESIVVWGRRTEGAAPVWNEDSERFEWAAPDDD